MPRLLTLRFSLSVMLAVGALSTIACGTHAPRAFVDVDSRDVARDAVWNNGDFEADANNTTPPSNWSLAYSINSGVSGTQLAAPRSFSALNANTQGAAIVATSTLAGVPGSQPDPDLGSGQSFRYPKYGNRAARINYSTSTANGKNKNTNTLRQSMVLSPNDIDLTDGKLHVRMAVAPVLEVPSHSYVQQPYYYIEVLNLTRGTTVYSSFNVAGQSGVPWRTTTSIATSNATQWLDWQLIDVAPGPLAWSVGDTVQLSAVASGCALGGHFGRLYLDSVAPTIPGLYVTAQGPQTASPNTTINYTLNYGNGGSASSQGSFVTFTTPPQTTFVSTTASGCTTPAVGAAGSIVCPIATLSPQATGSLQISVKLASDATGFVTAGTYGINNAASFGLLGMPTTLQVAAATTNLADVSVSAGAPTAAGNANDALSFSFVVTNNGPQALSAGTVSISDLPPPSLQNVTWSCAVTQGGASNTKCGIASGKAQILSRPTLEVGGAITYTVQATLAPNAAANGNTFLHTLSANVLGTQADPDIANNQASTLVTLGSAKTLQVTKAPSAALGTISASPGGVLCGTSCTTAQLSVANASSVRLLAAPSGGNSFVGWSGGCTGSAPVCTLSIAGNTNVVATFAPAPAAGAAASVTAVRGLNQYAAVGQSYQTPLMAYVGDANGLPVANANVTFAAPTSGASASLSPIVAVTNAFGFAQTTASATTAAGAISVSATAQGVSTPAAFALTNAGSPNNVVAVLGSSQSTATNSVFPTPLVVLVRDATNNPVPGVTVTFTAPTSAATASLSAASAISNAQGLASVVPTANPNTGTFTVTGAAAGVATAASFALTNNTATPSALYTVSGSGQTTTTGQAYDVPLIAVVSDNLGNALYNIPVTFVAPSSGQSVSLSPNAMSSNLSGLVQSSAVANAAAGSLTVVATAASVTSNANFLLTNNGSQYLVVDGGDGQAAKVNTAFAQPISVLATDNTGAPIVGLPVSFVATAQSSNVVVAAATATTDSTGHATMSVTAGLKVGSATISINSAQATAPTLVHLTNLVGTAATFTVTDGNNQAQSVLGNYNTTLNMTLTDAYNNPVIGEVVQFTEPSSGPTGTLASYQLATDANGQISVVATAGTQQGNYTVQIADAAVPGVQAAIHLQTTPGPAAFVLPQSGNAQTTVVHTSFAAPAIVRVTDAYNNPVVGAQVAFSAPASGASATVAGASVATDANGLASTALTANNIAGSYTVTTSVSGLSVASFPLTNMPGSPASISLVSGNNQNATVAQTYPAPVVLQVVDAYGNAVPAAPVSVSAPGAGASVGLNAGPYVTDGAGRISLSATANTVAGAVSLQVSAGAVQTSAALTNVAGPLAQLTAVSGTSQQAAVNANFTSPLVVGTTDAYGNAVSGVSLQFTGPTGSPNVVLSSTSVSTDSEGHAQINARAGLRTGGVTVTVATSSAGGSAPASFALTITAAPASVLTVISGNNQSVALGNTLTAPLVVQATDAYSNGVPNTPINFAVPSTGAALALAAPSGTTNSQGLVGIGGVANQTTGSYVVQASLAAGGANANFTVTNIATGTPKLVILSGDNQQALAGTMFAQPLVVRVQDDQNNIVQGAHVQFGVQSPNALVTLSTASTRSDAAGQATASATAQTAVGQAVITASLDSNVQVSFTESVISQPVSRLIVDAQAQTQATAVGTGFAELLGVHAQDALGNPVANLTLTWSAPATGASAGLSQATAVTDAYGYASVGAQANTTPGAYPVTVATGDGTVQASYLLRNLPAAAYHLVQVGTPASTASVNTAFASPLEVRLIDTVGNPVAYANIVFTAPQAGNPTALLTHTLVQTDVNGLAYVNAVASTQAGSYAVSAAYIGAAQPVVFALTNKALAFDHFVLAPQTSPQATGIATPFAQCLQAQAVDVYNNPIANLAVRFAAPSSGASAALSPNQTLSDAHGIVATTASANGVVGSYAATLSLAANPNQSTTFALQNVASTALSLSANSNTALSTQVQTAFATPLAVLVTDALGSPQSGITVRWRAPSSGASAAVSASTVSDANGRALVTATANSTTGSYSVVASVDGARLPVRFGLRNLPAASTTAVADPLSTPQVAAVSQIFLAPLSLVVRDTLGNPVVGAAVTFVVPSGSPSVVLSSYTAVTDAQGRAQVQGVANVGQGAYVVVAQVPSLGQSVSFNLSNSPVAPPVLLLATGGQQSAVAGDAFAKPVSFVIRAADGTAQAGLPVTLSSTPAGLTLAETELITDVNGYVQTQVKTSSTPGTFSVVASSSHVALNASAKLTVQPIATSLALSVAQTPLPIGASTSLMVTAAAMRGVAAGQVTFAIDGEAVGTAALDFLGQASLPTGRHTAVGMHTVSAHLDGTGAFGSADAAPKDLEVTGWVMSGDGGCSQGPAHSAAWTGYGVLAAAWALRRLQRGAHRKRAS